MWGDPSFSEINLTGKQIQIYGFRKFVYKSTSWNKNGLFREELHPELYFKGEHI